MTRSRSRTAVVAALLLALLVAPVAPAIGASATYVSITDATVTPGSPAPGDTVTVDATVRNLASSGSGFSIDYVRLLTDAGRVRGYAGDLGTLAPGSEIGVPLTTTFDSAGTYHLRVEAHGTTDTGEEKTVKYPVVVRVGERGPAVDVDVPNAVAGAASPVDVTVANGLDTAVRNVRVTLSGEGVRVVQPRRVAATVESGASETVTFDAIAADAGVHDLSATVHYSTSDADRETTYTVPVTFAPLREDVALTTERVGDGSALRVAVTNLGNAALRDVSIRGESERATVTGATLASVPAGETRTAVVNASGLSGETPVRVVASYDYGPDTRSGTVSADATVAANPGQIRLTGLALERENGDLHITGSASNVGLGAVDSVVVSVLPGEGVQPAYPGKEYFVGTVPESDFVSFDVYAATSANATSVPLEVTYLTDGARQTTTVEVPIDDARPATQPTESSDGGGGWLVPGLVGLLVVAGVAAAVYVGWTNYARGE
ncbi:hypothetical protein GCM10009037_12550 [Halarchaeum grantii]|uniref:CARDB protein n=1 Tax=Halarchaeum grantii TaxID=1193105 RepID=A0A830EU51_9EURY|nr:hypothetical protein [Halarchaeum grantii]GGL30345.1 hypothetical protein GCM10009037_12550 [Halarchaeum grantii]